MMEFTAAQIAEALQGKVEGDENVKVNNVAPIEQGKPGTLSFLSNPKYTEYIYGTEASIVIVNEDFKPEKPVKAALIKVPDAYQAFATLLSMYEQAKPVPEGIDSMSKIDDTAKVGEKVFVDTFAVIGKNAKIGDRVQIHAQAYVGNNVTIGAGTIIYPGVKIYHDCVIGKQVTIHAGAVIGADGFGFAPKKGENYQKIPQIGNVVLEDHVEIGANTCIDRATMGSTIIREGVKLDNLIQVAHNVEIGHHTVMASQVGISGSTKIGKDCMFGGQVGLAGHINIGDNVKAGAQAGISGNIKDNQTVLGSPAISYIRERKAMAVYRNLPELWRKLNDLEQKLNN
ncbi:MAG TPA: UDP-3-O-(3-hydroxymyristoyl)glucosamine N-acyltransferase [Salinivirga sp.]|nr:UDP-3-O-(3-hydroxymyristoyl)glucosamine N-acyltransferase [Salinivirga sp.]